ncbi:phosphocholine-specific phospholipase C [Mucilaginibacter aquaedulcis]|uniref:phosphocholine-specific phospholipase C n=1 Tax=Mucilaginibacter aquaedulcis TaxID=1187081 RepID=UPI0025B43AFB|nr:phospholipase C, phosphocholine-specific [Mucilaginibacter aquaedulcis]MDN3549157.1 phospholipase C, phosphocholine-specific [Mucilaginibacter aquaedulcis]
MDSRRDFLKKAALLSGGAAMMNMLPPAIQRAMAINPAAGSTYLDAEHIVILMQENRSFDHCFGTLQGVRGYNDPRAIRLPNQKPVWLQTDAAGNTYAPFRLNIKDTKVTWMGSLPHSRASQVDANNLGKYDKWLTSKQSGNKNYADMPLTLGHYTREDLPFNYGMADAFTVCDQNFCSAMTSTTPNRSFFWTGKITHEQDGLPKANIRNTDYTFGNMPWETFPELLEQNNISWSFYQNDLSCGGGFEKEERAWLANFGCNLLEFFKAYNVKFSDRYIKNLQKQAEDLPDQINKLQERTPADEATAIKVRESIRKKQDVLDNARSELSKWNKESYEKLSEKEKSLYRRAFVINSADENFRSIAELTYQDNAQERKVTIPKGDLLHQFRQDVNTGKLPTVSWLAGPENFSDHPTAPWYGAWYVSEVLDILTKNPEVWKKTIFIVTYDENDGYFDHIPPFSIPDAKLPGTGKVTAGIETEIEHVRLENELKQGIPKNQAREGAIGLGFRVPMLIASPWSRGGKVCSEVFDHTSTLQFLEGFVNKKYGKNIKLNNISQWRRTICGDLSSAFSPYNGDQLGNIPFLDRNKNVETIYNAKFKGEPTSFKKLSADEIAKISADPSIIAFQEKGIRPSCALPYELYTHGSLSADKKNFEIKLAAGNGMFGKNAAGSPFTVYAPVKYNDEVSKDEISRNWHFAVAAGDQLTYNWPVSSFENDQYHLRVHGPNGFYREFIGSNNNPDLKITCTYEKSKLNAAKLTGNIVVNIVNNDASAHEIVINDNGYKAGIINKLVAAKSQVNVVLDLAKNFNWYDFSVKLNDQNVFEERFAGRVETGAISKTDPVMGGVIA